MAARRLRLIWCVLAALWLLGSMRAFALWAHDPLYAYANSYDQIRYTNCFHFYPDRAATIAPQRNSPEAPFSDYRFIAADDPMCYWSSELVFTAMTAATWKIGEAFGSGPIHDARWVGAWRWLALLALSIGFSRAWLRRGETRAAIANALLVPLLFADPGNTLYLNTFYAEWTALLATYALVASALLWRDVVPRGARIAAFALALFAFALALSKIQHLLLPLGIAIVLLALERLRRARVSVRTLAIGFGALAGLGLQVAQLQRSGAMIDAIDQYNRADVVFTALLPFADDRAALLDDLGIDPACAIYSGHHAWEFPDMPEKVCSGLEHFSRGAELRVLITQPRLSLRLARAAVLALDPWIAKNLGEVEGLAFAPLPATQATLGRPMHAWPPLQWTILALPWLALAALLGARTRRRGRALEFTTMIALIMLGTLAVTVLGDGLADTAKQGHLIINAALAWWIVSLALLGARDQVSTPRFLPRYGA